MSGAEVVSRLAVVAGLVLIAVGIALGVTGMSVPAAAGEPGPSFSCGSAFSGDDSAAGRADVDEFLNGEGVDDRQLAECASKRTDRRTLALILIGVGVVSIIAVPTVLATGKKDDASVV